MPKTGHDIKERGLLRSQFKRSHAMVSGEGHETEAIMGQKLMRERSQGKT